MKRRVHYISNIYRIFLSKLSNCDHECAQHPLSCFELTVNNGKIALFPFIHPKQRTGETMKSYPLTIDTTNAIEMKPQSSSESVSSTSDQNIDTPIVDISTIEPSDTEWQDEINEIPFEYRQHVFASEYDQRFKEIVLGMVAALVMFLFIVTMVCASRRDPLDLKIIRNSISSSHSQDANGLLNEIVCLSNNNNHFINNNSATNNSSCSS